MSIFGGFLGVCTNFCCPYEKKSGKPRKSRGVFSGFPARSDGFWAKIPIEIWKFRKFRGHFFPEFREFREFRENPPEITPFFRGFNLESRVFFREKVPFFGVFFEKKTHFFSCFRAGVRWFPKLPSVKISTQKMKTLFSLFEKKKSILRSWNLQKKKWKKKWHNFHLPLYAPCRAGGGQFSLRFFHAETPYQIGSKISTKWRVCSTFI